MVKIHVITKIYYLYCDITITHLLMIISYNHVHYFIHIDVRSSNDGTMTNTGHAMFARDNMAATTSETGYNESEIANIFCS